MRPPGGAREFVIKDDQGILCTSVKVDRLLTPPYPPLARAGELRWLDGSCKKAIIKRKD